MLQFIRDHQYEIIICTIVLISTAGIAYGIGYYVGLGVTSTAVAAANNMSSNLQGSLPADLPTLPTSVPADLPILPTSVPTVLYDKATQTDVPQVIITGLTTNDLQSINIQVHQVQEIVTAMATDEQMSIGDMMTNIEYMQQVLDMCSKLTEVLVNNS